TSARAFSTSSFLAPSRLSSLVPASGRLLLSSFLPASALSLAAELAELVFSFFSAWAAHGASTRPRIARPVNQASLPEPVLRAFMNDPPKSGKFQNELGRWNHGRSKVQTPTEEKRHERPVPQSAGAPASPPGKALAFSMTWTTSSAPA